MIVTSIRYIDKYKSLHKDFEAAFELLKLIEENQAESTITHKNLTCQVAVKAKSDPKTDEGVPMLEAHKKYIDIHYIIDGEESFGYANIGTLIQATEYEESDDYLFYKGNLSSVKLNKGDVCIVYPEDAHAPSMPSGNSKNVKRTVIKIEV